MDSRAGSPSSHRRGPPPPEPSVIIGDYRRLNEIGKGSFAMVYKGVHVKKGALVAIKSVNLVKLTKKLRENLEAEVRILRTLHHPHIVALFDCRESKTQVHLMMEYCELGDLSTFIRKRSSLGEHEATADMIRKYPNPSIGGLNEVVVRHFLQQIASALQWIRAKSFLHRDIKPQNLLLVPSPLWTEKHRSERTPLMMDDRATESPAGIESLPMLKIADFGFARFLPSLTLAETLCGSPLYMAPEILRYEKYDAKADLWSVGTVLHEMMVGKPPFRANNHVDLLRKIEKNLDVIKFSEGLAISKDMKNLIRALLKKNPIERISYEAFFEDVVITSDIPGLVGEDRLPERLTYNLASRISRSRPSEASGAGEDSRPEQESSTQSQERLPSPLSPRSRQLSLSQVPQISQTPPRSSDKRPSVTPASSDPSTPKVRERRTTSSGNNANAAIGRQPDRQVPTPASAERQVARNTPSPRNSMLKEHLDRERGRLDERNLRETRERAAQDVAFERDYVLVEKKFVEVNAFADELANSPQVHGGYRDQPTTTTTTTTTAAAAAAAAAATAASSSSSPPSSSSQQQGVVARRTIAAGPIVPASSAPQSNVTRAMQITNRQTNPLHHRTGSYDRAYGRSPSSATSAISKALNKANFRLFGMGFSPPQQGRGPSPPHGYSAYPVYPTAQTSALLVGDGGKSSLDSPDEDWRIAMLVEDLAHRSDVVYGFSNVKYVQLAPIQPSNTPGLGIEGAGASNAHADPTEDDEDLTTDQVVIVAEEALVLYVKALATLRKIMDISGSWWGQRHVEFSDSSPRSAPTQTSPHYAAMKINGVVQWSRNRFNECLDKSEYVRRRLTDAQKQLPIDHPGHPSNHPTISTSSVATSVGTSAENITLTTGVTAERLMYDRAIDMSRTAAINEVINVDLEGGELSYKTAIYLLEAILDDDDDTTAVAIGNKPKSRDGSTINGLTGDDRKEITNILEGLKNRLNAIKLKLGNLKEGRRLSNAQATSSNNTVIGARNSPSGTPALHQASTSPRD